MSEATSTQAKIRVGIGGWTFEPWRDNFYPAAWPHARELEYASRKLTAIEINGTYYSSQKPATFAKWRDETPDDFMFSVKASRFATNRRVLAEAGESIARFVASGIAELGPKLGPIVWQFATTKTFEPDDFGAAFGLCGLGLAGGERNLEPGRPGDADLFATQPGDGGGDRGLVGVAGARVGRRDTRAHAVACIDGACNHRRADDGL